MPGAAYELDYALFDEAEALYRRCLPSLSVCVHAPDGDVTDYLHDVLLHGRGCVTSVLLSGSGGAYDESVHAPLGAITVRVIRPDSGGGGVGDGGGDGSGDGGRDGGGDGGNGGGAAPARIEILTCAVQRGGRRRGIGTLLARWVQQLAANEGVRCMLVAAGADATPFWAKMGFAPPPAQLPQEWVTQLQVRPPASGWNPDGAPLSPAASQRFAM